MDRRRFNDAERKTAFLQQDGMCPDCGNALGDDFEMDHNHPFSAGGETTQENAVATCRSCNRKKAARVGPTLRDWQDRALRTIVSAVGDGEQSVVVVAVPGSGKTTLAGAVAQRLLAGSTQLIVVVPTDHLRGQWADSLWADFRISISKEWNPGRCVWSKDYRGVVVTYHQVNNNAEVFAHHCRSRQVVVVLDELHHCSDRSEWGSSVERAFTFASMRLILSGTPFRSDGHPIPFVKYPDGTPHADVYYSYGSAIRDGVCRKIQQRTRDGEIRWEIAEPGSTKQFNHQLSEALPERDARKRLVTAVSTGSFLPELLREANDQLIRFRERDHDAAAIVTTASIAEAERAGQLLRGMGIDPVVITSKDDDEGTVSKEGRRRLLAFASKGATQPWCVTVKMVSEGVDIPRLRVGVYATTTMTEVLYQQFLGRLLRREADHDEHMAVLYLPADPTLVQYAENIHEEIERAISEARKQDPSLEMASRDEVVRSFFTPIDSTLEKSASIDHKGSRISDLELKIADQYLLSNPRSGLTPEEIADIRRFQPPLSLHRDKPAPKHPDEEKKDLRDSVIRKVSDIVKACEIAEDYRGKSPQQIVHGWLNKRLWPKGVTTQTASIEQMKKKADMATRLLEQRRWPPLL